MVMSPEVKARRLAETKEAAAALIEDLPYIRNLLDKAEPERGEVRRLSAILRRLLVDDDLGKIVAPRLGKFELIAPDNNPVYRADSKNPLAYFESGGAVVFGVYLRAAMINAGSAPRALAQFDPEATVGLKLDSFLAQRVLCLNGRWASRRAVVKFAANVASGVHSGSAETEDEKLIQRLRHSVAYRLAGGACSITFNPSPPTGTFVYDANSLDPVLVELLAAATFVVKSPDVRLVEDNIKNELHL